MNNNLKLLKEAILIHFLNRKRRVQHTEKLQKTEKIIRKHKRFFLMCI